jgi:DNA polymerase theta
MTNLTTTNLSSILSIWNFPETIINKYESLNIKEIFQWQLECLNTQGVLNLNRNLIYSAPTSAGKTLVAELLMIKNVIETKRKAIMILPFVSLAKEKLKYLQSILDDDSIRVEGFIGNSKPNGGFNACDIAICTIEKANSLINKLIEDDQLFEVGIIVIDELHMIGDQSRGYLLELILSKLKYLCIKDSKYKTKKNTNNLIISVIKKHVFNKVI